jgi:zinc/manganese transport system substrate-binding protein
VLAPKSSVLALAVAILALGVLAACGSTADRSTTSGAEPVRLSIVTSTDVYGDIARQLAGSDADVTAVISNPNADPHEYAADAQDALAVSKAAVIIENGGGYDDFMAALTSSVAKKSTAVLDASALSGLDAGSNTGSNTMGPGASFNEHVWYDFNAVLKLAQALTAQLTQRDPEHAAGYTARDQRFESGVRGLQAREKTIEGAHAGAAVAVTEPVPLYLLQACGLVDRTPAAFSQAIEAGSDVAPRVLQDMLGLLSRRQVALLAYNEQTTDATTDKVLAAAHTAGVPVVPVTETLPAGQNYLSWMTANLTAVQTALASS